MKAVILAGGLGTRLRPLSEKVPKVMFSVNGKPFILHLLALLRRNGISSVVLCVGYLGEQVKEYLGDGRKWRVNITYSEEREQLLGTGGALKQAENLLGEQFFVINGDTYLPIDYGEMGRLFVERGKKAVMAVYDNRENTGVRNNVDLDDDLIVVRHDKKGGNSSLRYVEAGVLILKRDVLDFIESGRPVSLEGGLYPALIQQKELAAYITEQRFYDIGTPEQLKTFETFLTRSET